MMIKQIVINDFFFLQIYKYIFKTIYLSFTCMIDAEKKKQWKKERDNITEIQTPTGGDERIIKK
jgi:hypothetical protein